MSLTYPFACSNKIFQSLFGILGLRARLSEPTSESRHKQNWRTYHEHERFLVGTRCWNHLHLPTWSMDILRYESKETDPSKCISPKIWPKLYA